MWYMHVSLLSVHSHLKEYGQYTLLLHRHGNTDNITCSFLLGNAPLDSDLRKQMVRCFDMIVLVVYTVLDVALHFTVSCLHGT